MALLACKSYTAPKCSCVVNGLKRFELSRLPNCKNQPTDVLHTGQIADENSEDDYDENYANITLLVCICTNDHSL